MAPILYSGISARRRAGRYIVFRDDYKNRRRIPALPFSRIEKIVAKPLGMKYVENPVTIGQKIRNRRLQLRLLQRDVAAMLDVTEDTVTLWENERSKPLVYHYPKLIEFLGYVPFEIDTSTLAGWMKKYRYLNGLSQEELAHKLGINESTAFHYEKGTHKPSKSVMMQLRKLISNNYSILTMGARLNENLLHPFNK